jgi:hypothetical protein
MMGNHDNDTPYPCGISQPCKRTAQVLSVQDARWGDGWVVLFIISIIGPIQRVIFNVGSNMIITVFISYQMIIK